MSVLHICPGPVEQATAPDDRPTRWCFGCRAHLPHTWAILFDPPERQPSFYEPVPVIRCSRCGEDRTLFPGLSYDGPHYPSEGVWRNLMEGLHTVTKTWDWDAILERSRREWAAA